MAEKRYAIYSVVDEMKKAIFSHHMQLGIFNTAVIGMISFEFHEFDVGSLASEKYKYN